MKGKQRILLRDKNKCVRCGRNTTTVHHILPRHLFPEYKNDELNLVSVCNSCHRFIHDQYGEPSEPNIDWFIQRYYLALRIPLLKRFEQSQPIQIRKLEELLK